MRKKKKKKKKIQARIGFWTPQVKQMKGLFYNILYKFRLFLQLYVISMSSCLI